MILIATACPVRLSTLGGNVSTAPPVCLVVDLPFVYLAKASPTYFIVSKNSVLRLALNIPMQFCLVYRVSGSTEPPPMLTPVYAISLTTQTQFSRAVCQFLEWKLYGIKWAVQSVFRGSFEGCLRYVRFEQLNVGRSVSYRTLPRRAIKGFGKGIRCREVINRYKRGQLGFNPACQPNRQSPNPCCYF